MKKTYLIPLMVSIVAIGLSTLGVCKRTQVDLSGVMAEQINSVDDVIALFPTSPQEITEKADAYMDQAKQAIDAIIAIPDEERTFKNTAGALDHVGSIGNLAIWGNVISVVEITSTDKAMRDTAHDTALTIQAFWVDHVSNNKPLYDAFKAYVEGNAKNEKLDDEQRYFLKEEMKGFKRAGLDLPDDERAELTALKKELAELASNFSRNIAQDASSITVTKAGLSGIDQDAIANFKQDDAGNYILGVDYPTYFTVMENCSVEETRKRLYIAFNNRAYPANSDLLKQIIAKRDTLAKMLGYESFAAFDIEEQMVKKPERVKTFLADLIDRSREKEDQEIEQIKSNLPESVSLTEEDTFKPWDLAYAKNQYKKKHLAVDEQKIAQYFPMSQTIEALLDVYREFLSVDFEEVPVTGLWHDDVRMIKVHTKADGEKPLGYLLLDLFPRPNKYSHACHASIVHGVIGGEKQIPVVSVVLANFQKQTKTKPSLLKRDEVETFFHEFGHAIHALLGATQMGSFSGTSVKRDFVEMPSQMLEEWLWDANILKKVSGHYETGEPLPDDLIEKIVALKQFSTGSFVQRQSFLSLLALNYFLEGGDKDPDALYKELYKKYVRHMALDPENHMFASFGHLTGYSSKYYGYLWSKVFALDMFEQIEKAGLLNPQMGQKYIREVIGRGGSADPNELLRNFLGREPRQDAFMRSMGLEGTTVQS